MANKLSFTEAIQRFLNSIDANESWNIRPWSFFAAISTLTPIEQIALALLYGLHDGICHTDLWVARDLHVPVARVRRVERIALRKLRHPSRRRLITSDTVWPMGGARLLGDRTLSEKDSIESLGLPPWVRYMLRPAGISSVGELRSAAADELPLLYVAQAALGAIRHELAQYGLTLRGDEWMLEKESFEEDFDDGTETWREKLAELETEGSSKD